MKLVPVDSAHLIWPRLEAEIQRLIDKTGERFSPVYVLKRIQENNAGLFAWSDNGILGYMIVERYDQGGEVWMNVWMIVGDGMTPERIREGIPQVDELARSVGAKAWRLTGRKGWERALRGFVEPVATVYERKLT